MTEATGGGAPPGDELTSGPLGSAPPGEPAEASPLVAGEPDPLAGVPMALYVQDAHPIREAMGFVQRAEQLGFAAVWQADSRLVREATVPMAAFAATTDRIAVGSGVIDVWTRNPARLASLFSTLDDLAPGRVLAGLGAWWDPLAAKVGISRDRPLRVMREVVESLRALLRCDGPVTYDGAYVHLDGVELDYVHQERRPKHVPIYIGATGMRMMQLAGEVADGAVLNYLVSAAYNGRALAALAEGAERAGRTVDEIDRPQLVVCSLDADRDAAMDAARLLVTQYLGQQPHIMAASGVPTSLLEDIGRVLTWPAGHEQVVKASKLVPDEIVQMLCAAGTAEECRTKVAEYVRTGCTSPVLYPLGDVAATLEAFAPVPA
jgi:5,10-methylenetetrahydromethanopterin reductase